MAILNGTRYRTAGERWPEAALSNAFVRNVAKAGRYCDEHSGRRASHSNDYSY